MACKLKDKWPIFVIEIDFNRHSKFISQNIYPFYKTYTYVYLHNIAGNLSSNEIKEIFNLFDKT